MPSGVVIVSKDPFGTQHISSQNPHVCVLLIAVLIDLSLRRLLCHSKIAQVACPTIDFIHPL